MNKLIFFNILIVLTFSYTQLTQASKCRALAFRGGGDKGPYEVGAL